MWKCCPQMNAADQSKYIYSQAPLLFYFRASSEVSVSHVDNPAHFFVHHKNNWDTIDALSTKLNEFYQVRYSQFLPPALSIHFTWNTVLKLFTDFGVRMTTDERHISGCHLTPPAENNIIFGSPATAMQFLEHVDVHLISVVSKTSCCFYFNLSESIQQS